MLQEPDLNKMWRTRVGIDGMTHKSLQDTIRKKIQPVLQLEKHEEILVTKEKEPDKHDNPADDIILAIIFLIVILVLIYFLAREHVPF